MKKLSFVQRLFWLINIIMVLLLLVTYLSPYIDPNFFWPAAFAGLSYFIILAVNLIFILFWMIQKKLHFIASLLAILIGWNHIGKFVHLHFKDDNKDGIVLMSYNVKNFDLYNWTESDKTREQIFQLIYNEQPSILCIQEFHQADKGKFQNIEYLKEKIGFVYHYFGKSITINQHNHWGLATFSTYPITGTGNIDINNNNRVDAIFTDILINDETIRIYNLHLQSLHFNKEDYRYLEEVKEKKNPDLLSSKKIGAKMKTAFKKRALQSRKIAEHIQSSPYPVIVCGDFNDTPLSFSYNVISKDLKNGFATAGTGINKTYSGPVPILNIDHILFDKNFKVHDFNIPKKAYSDHYPLVSEFSLKK